MDADPAWYRQCRVLVGLGMWEALLERYIPYHEVHSARLGFFQVRKKDEGWMTLLTKRYWEWYQTHKDVQERIRREYGDDSDDKG